MRTVLGIALVLLCSVSASATPACYREAENAAHIWATSTDAASWNSLTGLSPDGLSCVQVRLWRGEPLRTGAVFVPFRQVVEAYTTGLQVNSQAVLQRVHTWLKPTPRRFGTFAELVTVQEGIPLELGGGKIAQRLIHLLRPSKDTALYALSSTPAGDITVGPLFWGILYLYMGGMVYNDPMDEWTKFPQDTSFISGYASLAQTYNSRLQVLLVKEEKDNRNSGSNEKTINVRGEY